jgi:hypothetical protein
MVIFCGMAVKSVGVVGVSVRWMEVQTVKVDSELIGNVGRMCSAMGIKYILLITKGFY